VYQVNYVGFTRKNKLIVIEFAIITRTCAHGYEGDEIKKCKAEEQEKKIRIDEFVELLVKGLTFK
jgi:hypothetical protein